jgi:predicted transcriptional regulator
MFLLRKYTTKNYSIKKVIKMDDDDLSTQDIKNIEEGLADIKAGRTYTTKELSKNWNYDMDSNLVR